MAKDAAICVRVLAITVTAVIPSLFLLQLDVRRRESILTAVIIQALRAVSLLLETSRSGAQVPPAEPLPVFAMTALVALCGWRLVAAPAPDGARVGDVP